MPNLDYILQGLRTSMPGSTRRPTANEPAELDLLQGAFGDEARTRGRAAQRTLGMPNGASRDEVTGLMGISDDWNSDQAENTVSQQRPMIDAFNADNYAAQASGFGAFGGPSSDTSEGTSPMQSREIYRRKFEQEKMRQPVQTTAMEQEGGLARARENTRGMVEQATIGADSRIAQAENMAQLATMFGGRGVNRISTGGGNSMSFDTSADQAPNAAYAALTAARTELEAAKRNAPGSFLGMKNPFASDQTPIRQATMDQAVQGYLGQLDPQRFSPQIKAKAFELYSNSNLESPDDPNETSEMILQDIWNTNPEVLNVDENGYYSLLEILQAIRGK